MVSLAKKLKSELWGFCALVGLFCIHTGIVLAVFALKHATPHPVLLKIVGILLVVVGVVTVLASWYFHRQQRKERPMLLCCTRLCGRCRCCRECGSQSELFVPVDETQDRRKPRGMDAPTTVTGPSGFSTPEFRIYSDFMKRDIHGVEGRQQNNDFILSTTQNAMYYTHKANHISTKNHHSRAKILPIAKPRKNGVGHDHDNNNVQAISHFQIQ